MTETVLKNARLVLEDETIHGSICFDETGIRSIDAGETAADGLDCEGDYVIPGLVELHTDNVERHFLPRPTAYWPNHTAAVLAHDHEIAGAGITTVFDSLSVGDYDGNNSPRRELFGHMCDGIVNAMDAGLCKVEHRLHFRCELSDPYLLGTLEPLVEKHHVALASLMDHTPGQRQWRDTSALKAFMKRTGLSDAEVEASLLARIARSNQHTPENWKAVLKLFEGRDVTLATHDDASVDDVNMGHAEGIKISEFPCSLEAAQRANELGMTTIGGAPNIVRGGSHSGNVAIMDLARAGVLDALSSDYVPGALLQAVFILSRELDLPLHETIKTVTVNNANMVGLTDRGVLALGQRSDVVLVRDFNGTPIVREVFAQGRRVC